MPDGWKKEALALRKLREEDSAAMNALMDLVEAHALDAIDVSLLYLALHHVAVCHGAYARPKTMKKMHKASIETLSVVAPQIYPPERVVVDA